MSLRSNVLANYVSQLYVVLVGIVMVPVYVHYMGVEAFGLIGFYTMLQAWFLLLDMGFTPTIAREAARFRGGATDAQSLRDLLRILECVFVGVGLLGAAAMLAGAGTIAAHWLKVQQLPLGEVRQAIMLMAVIVALRWVCGLYRGAITGFERLVWLSGLNIVVGTVRFVFVIPYLIYVGASPTAFFGYQLVVAVAEAGMLVAKTYSLLPRLSPGQRVRWKLEPLRRLVRFSLSIAFTGSVWVMVTQTDKLLLSKLLHLTEYAYFTLAVLVASGVILVGGPISSAIVPRLTKLAAEGDEAELIRLYRNGTQLVGVVVAPAALVLAFFAEQVLWAWTGDADIAHNAAPVLTLYAVGNGILAFAAFPYYLQYAKGDLRLHLRGSVLFLVLLIPTLVWTTLQFGVSGAGYAWLGANAVYFLVWVPKVHERFSKGLHAQWLVHDVGVVVLLTTTGALLAYSWISWPQGRVSVTLVIALLCLVLLLLAATGSSWARQAIRSEWRTRFRGK